MARFSFGIWDSTSSTYLSGESVQIKDAADGTVLASTVDIGVGLLVSPNGDGTYYCDSIPSQNLWVYVAGALQDELANIPWDDGDATTHIANVTTSVHGSGGQVTGQTDVDDSSIEYSGGYRVKALGIVEAMLGALAVTAGKIASNAVTTVKIINDAVTTAKILDANVTGAKLASAVAGDGLTQNGSGNLDLDLSVDAGEVDLEFNASNALRLIKSLSSQVYITEGMTLMQMLSVLDNRLRQVSEASGPENGGYYQILYSLFIDDSTPSASLTSPTWVTSSAAYVDGLVMPVVKIPEMRQIVVYYRASVSNALADAYLKVLAGSLSSESAVIESTTAGNYAVYLDITSLPNWETFELQIEVKVSGGYNFTIDQVSAVVRSEVTALAGETTYENPNPVE